MQSTASHKYFAEALNRLSKWAVNPWRRYSLLLINFLLGFLFGSFTVFLLESMIRLRNIFKRSARPLIFLGIIYMLRIGIVYGLFTEALKLM